MGVKMDNVPITAGTGTDIATDDVSGVQFQKVKIDVGADGVSTPLSTTNPVPVALPAATVTTLTPPAAITGFATSAKQLADGHNVVVSSGAITETNSGSIKTAVEAIDNCISGNEAQVDIVAALPTGTNVIGAVKKDVINYTAIRKYYTNAGAVTDGIVWSPAAGKKWVITDIIINTSAAATVTLEEDLAGGDSPFMKLELAANGGVSTNFQTPLMSTEDDADLIITTSAGNIYVTVSGYEID